MKLPKHPKALIYDMDGVTDDTDGMYQRALAKSGSGTCCWINHEMLLGAVGLSGKKCRKMLPTAHSFAISTEKLIADTSWHSATSANEG